MTEQIILSNKRRRYICNSYFQLHKTLPAPAQTGLQYKNNWVDTDH